MKQISLHPVGNLYRGASQLTTFLSLVFVCVLLVVQAVQANRAALPGRLKQAAWRCRWVAYAALILCIALFGMSGREFVYFQF